MLSNEKISLLEVWHGNPFAAFTISDIMKLTGKKTKTWVFNALKLMVRLKILKSELKGNLNIYALNINNPLSIQLLQYLEVQDSINFPHLGAISEIIGKMPVKGFCLVVFGSYAEKKQARKSDMDVCLLIESEEAERSIRPYLNEIKLGTEVDIDEHYITFGDFIKMLLRKEENLGKQIFRKHRLFYNPEIYYQLIKEAYKNGFRP